MAKSKGLKSLTAGSKLVQQIQRNSQHFDNLTSDQVDLLFNCDSVQISIWLRGDKKDSQQFRDLVKLKKQTDLLSTEDLNAITKALNAQVLSAVIRQNQKALADLAKRDNIVKTSSNETFKDFIVKNRAKLGAEFAQFTDFLLEETISAIPPNQFETLKIDIVQSRPVIKPKPKALQAAEKSVINPVKPVVQADAQLQENQTMAPQALPMRRPVPPVAPKPKTHQATEVRRVGLVVEKSPELPAAAQPAQVAAVVKSPSSESGDNAQDLSVNTVSEVANAVAGHVGDLAARAVPLQAGEVAATENVLSGVVAAIPSEGASVKKRTPPSPPPRTTSLSKKVVPPGTTNTAVQTPPPVDAQTPPSVAVVAPQQTSLDRIKSAINDLSLYPENEHPALITLIERILGESPERIELLVKGDSSGSFEVNSNNLRLLLDAKTEFQLVKLAHLFKLDASYQEGLTQLAAENDCHVRIPDGPIPENLSRELSKGEVAAWNAVCKITETLKTNVSFTSAEKWALFMFIQENKDQNLMQFTENLLKKTDLGQTDDLKNARTKLQEEQVKKVLTPDEWAYIKGQFQRDTFIDAGSYQKTLTARKDIVDDAVDKYEKFRTQEKAVFNELDKLAQVDMVQWMSPGFQAIARKRAEQLEKPFENFSKTCAIACDLLQKLQQRYQHLLESLPEPDPDPANAAWLDGSRIDDKGQLKAIQQHRKDLESQLAKIGVQLQKYEALYHRINGNPLTPGDGPYERALRQGILPAIREANDPQRMWHLDKSPFAFTYTDIGPDGVKGGAIRKEATALQALQSNAQPDNYFLESEKLPQGSVREYKMSYTGRTDQGAAAPNQEAIFTESHGPARDVSDSYTRSAVPITMTVKKFPNDGDEKAQVEFALAFASQMLVSMGHRPSVAGKNPIYLSGYDKNELGMIWAALQVLGKSHPKYQFGPKSVEVLALAYFNPAKEGKDFLKKFKDHGGVVANAQQAMSQLYTKALEPVVQNPDGQPKKTPNSDIKQRLFAIKALGEKISKKETELNYLKSPLKPIK